MVITYENDVDIVLTYAPCKEMTGHLREVLDYYIFFKENNIKTKILLMTPLTKESIQIVLDQYKQTLYTTTSFWKDTTLVNDFEKLKIIKALNSIVFICDGNIRALKNYKIIISAKKIFGFLCGIYNFDELSNDKIYGNITYLQDFRIYGQNKLFNSINYIKKINFDNYKNYDCDVENTALLYLTYNCRRIPSTMIMDIYNKYDIKEYLILSNDPNILNTVYPMNIVIKSPPQPNIFEKFNTYIYTPIDRHFDCSPRFIAECKFYKKDVIYYNIDYIDRGLETRMYDIDNNFKSLFLRKNDSIIDILFK